MDADVHPEMRLGDFVAHAGIEVTPVQKALVQQRLDDVHHGRNIRPRRQVEHGFGAVDRETAIEDGALRQRRLFPG